MPAEQSWADAMRAESLAKLFLTRQQGVEVIPVRQAGYDLLVRIRNKNAPAEFAVEAKGTRKWPLVNSTVRVQISLDNIGPTDIPLLLLLFDVEKERGAYQWLQEPVVDASGKSRLVPNPVLLRERGGPSKVAILGHELRELDDHAVKEILHRVLHWHEVRNPSAAYLETGGEQDRLGG